MDTKILQDIGFSTGEAKVYLALLRLGTTKTGALAIRAGVSSSKIYKILDRLKKKGLAGHVMKGKIKFYSAMEPKRVLQYMNEKEKELSKKRVLVESLIPQLEMERTLSIQKTEVTIYDGFKGITNLFSNILDELKRGETYYVLGAAYGPKIGSRPFYYKHHTTRAKKGIKVKMLANDDIKGKLEKSTYLNSEIRYLPQYLMSKMIIVFYKSTAFIVLWTEDPKAFLIESEEAVKGFKAYFDTFWKIAQKIVKHPHKKK